MTWPATNIANRTAGEFVDDTDWDELVDALNFLANRPACRVSHNTTQSLTSGTEATLAFNTEALDTDTMHDTVTNNSRITFKTAGLFVVTWGFTVAADNDYLWIYSYLRLNGTTLIAPGSSIGTQTDNGLSPHSAGATLYKFAVNDYVEVRAAQKNTSAAANNVSTNNHFAAVWNGRG